MMEVMVGWGILGQFTMSPKVNLNYPLGWLLSLYLEVEYIKIQYHHKHFMTCYMTVYDSRLKLCNNPGIILKGRTYLRLLCIQISLIHYKSPS